jgi:hypothetical protein
VARTEVRDSMLGSAAGGLEADASRTGGRIAGTYPGWVSAK